MPLWKKILIGMGLGVIVGVAWGNSEVMGLTVHDFKPLGDLFIKLIKMIMIPIIFFSMIGGITALDDPSKLGRIGLKALGMFLGTTIIAIIIGLSVANIVDPGKGFDINKAMEGSDNSAKSAQVIANAEKNQESGIADAVLGIVPANPIAAMSDNGAIFQVIFFAVLVGIALTQIGDKAKPILALTEAINETIYKIIDFIMALAPYAVFGIMVYVTGVNGLEVILTLMKLVVTFLISISLLVLIVFVPVLKFYVKVPPLTFFRKLGSVLAVAFSTSSSSATLPLNLKNTHEKVGVTKPTADFVLPLGATVNMNGLALYQGICAVFAAQVFGIDLTIGAMITVVATVTIAAIGAAGIPGTGLIMMALVMDSIGLNTVQTGAIIGVVLGVDRILDMFRTMINVTGDCFVATVVDKSEGTLNEEVLHSRD